ncbi:hypothetical protein LshimejAT787_0904900 [Lyophyllum shimeji]|uniref:Uncharacterized protein n=1 Tax=Lyophyllum shimeji TaxID=47721 RepID=A0A9P3URF5_LYOSH|nr:hypothetical protein LshimejAT787_0904900 [Lyophyllum shimeji]
MGHITPGNGIPCGRGPSDMLLASLGDGLGSVNYSPHLRSELCAPLAFPFVTSRQCVCVSHVIEATDQPCPTGRPVLRG